MLNLAYSFPDGAKTSSGTLCIFSSQWGEEMEGDTPVHLSSSPFSASSHVGETLIGPHDALVLSSRSAFSCEFWFFSRVLQVSHLWA